jgi:N-alpha-acetyltransferase 15/16, NatA auxiliary subunit
MAQAQQQQLGHKDASLFRQVVRHFENKQYKKGEDKAL